MASNVFDPLSTGTTYVDPRQTTAVDWTAVANNALGGFLTWKTANSNAQQTAYANGQVPQTRTYAGTVPSMDLTPFIMIGGFGLAAILLLKR